MPNRFFRVFGHERLELALSAVVIEKGPTRVAVKYRELSPGIRCGHIHNPHSFNADTGTVVSKRNWNIEFDTGKASFTADGERKMYEIKDDLAIAGALFVTLNGHTDNTGTREGNMDLAERRAQAVRDWLQRKAPSNFPDSRFRIHAYGDSKPLASNATVEGRAKNRRVEIILSGKE